MSGALAADPLQAAALSALDSCCRGACSSPVPVLTAGTRTLLHQQLPGTGWERADNWPAAKPAQPMEKQHCRPSIATPNAHVAGQDHSSMLFCESSASSPRQECSAWAERPLHREGPVHLVWLPLTPASIRHFKGPHSSSWSISNNLPTGNLSSKLPSVGVLIKCMCHCCALPLSGL